MRIFAGFLIAAVTLAVVSSSSAAVPPFAWWTVKQANRNVVWANPQYIRNTEITVVRAACVGAGASRMVNGNRTWRRFWCDLTYRDERYSGLRHVRLFVGTSTRERDEVCGYSLGGRLFPDVSPSCFGSS
mgnify:FL=1